MLNITSLNNLSAYRNGFMERWIISLIDSVVNPFLTIRRYTMRFRLLRQTKSSDKRLVLVWCITYYDSTVLKIVSHLHFVHDTNDIGKTENQPQNIFRNVMKLILLSNICTQVISCSKYVVCDILDKSGFWQDFQL